MTIFYNFLGIARRKQSEDVNQNPTFFRGFKSPEIHDPLVADTILQHITNVFNKLL